MNGCGYYIFFPVSGIQKFVALIEKQGKLFLCQFFGCSYHPIAHYIYIRPFQNLDLTHSLVQKIKAGAVEDFRLRTQKEMNELRRLPQLQDEGSLKQINDLQKYLETSAGKVVNKMLFSLKGKVSDQVFRECMEVLGEVF